MRHADRHTRLFLFYFLPFVSGFIRSRVMRWTRLAPPLLNRIWTSRARAATKRFTMSYSRPPPRIEGMVSLKVDNLTYRTTPEDLRRVFERCGEVGDIYIPRDRFTRESRGFAFVRYVNHRSRRGDVRTPYQKWSAKMITTLFIELDTKLSVVRKVELPHLLGRGSLWWQYAVIRNFDLIWFASYRYVLVSTCDEVESIHPYPFSYTGFMINAMLKMR